MAFIDIVEMDFNKFAKILKESIERDLYTLELFKQFLTLCESPMEQLFLIELINFLGSYRYWNLSDKYVFIVGAPSVIFGERFKIKIHPQYEINLENSTGDNKLYRVDFLITLNRIEATKEEILKSYAPLSDYSLDISERRFYPEYLTGTTIHSKIIVEIDGHDYHERTKEQATKDKSRDRLLNSKGFIVFRFTGSEIYNDAAKAAREISNYIGEQADEVIKKLGI